jgi:hypothetical protein
VIAGLCSQLIIALPLIQKKEAWGSNNEDEQMIANHDSFGITQDVSVLPIVKYENENGNFVDLENDHSGINTAESLGESEEKIAEEDPLSGICQTPECIQQLQQYMEWRQKNGYPVYSGRWGK